MLAGASLHYPCLSTPFPLMRHRSVRHRKGLHHPGKFGTSCGVLARGAGERQDRMAQQVMESGFSGHTVIEIGSRTLSGSC